MIQSVERAITILNTVARYRDWIGVRELARRINLKVPTVQNLCKTLESSGYLDFDQITRGYKIGITLHLLSVETDPLGHLREFLKPYLEELFSELEETVTVATYYHGKIYVVESIAGDHQLTVLHKHEIVNNPLALASGRLIAAFIGAAERKSIIDSAKKKDPGFFKNNMKNLDKEFKNIISKGMAEVENYNDCGISAIAVPVFGGANQIYLSLACSAPMNRFKGNKMSRVRAILLKYAKKLSIKLGKLQNTREVSNV